MSNISGTTIVLRLEGAALALLCIWLYGGVFHGQWWLFALLILVPDASMLGYLAGPRIGAAAYNVVHSWVTVVVLFFVVWNLFEADALLMKLLFILGAHIGIDRALGFGLKHRTGFKDTHLGQFGKVAG